jgi:hypothetical protein
MFNFLFLNQGIDLIKVIIAADIVCKYFLIVFIYSDPSLFLVFELELYGHQPLVTG